MSGRPLALRLDDVGASTKRWNMHSRWQWRRGRLRISGNWLFLKALPGLRGWAPYREMTGDEWRRVCDILAAAGARMTVAVTACWVRWSGELQPFPEVFPDEAAALAEGVTAGLIEIASHGLTHCVLAGHAFRPRLFDSNRQFHREFGERVPPTVQAQQIERSLSILSAWIGRPVTVLVPPGDQFVDATVEAAKTLGVTTMTGTETSEQRNGMAFVGKRDTVVLHDRDLVLGGVDALRRRLVELRDSPLRFVSEVAEIRC